MDADHVSAWSKGGGSTAENCQMLCVTHNRAKGNQLMAKDALGAHARDELGISEITTARPIQAALT
jgi:hypothetical protein